MCGARAGPPDSSLQSNRTAGSSSPGAGRDLTRLCLPAPAPSRSRWTRTATTARCSPWSTADCPCPLSTHTATAGTTTSTGSRSGPPVAIPAPTPPPSNLRVPPISVRVRCGRASMLAAMLIRDATADDWPQIWPFLRRIVAAGETFTWDRDVDEEQARATWMHEPPGRTIVAVGADGSVLGTAETHPNQGGPGAHIANAGFMVDPDHGGAGGRGAPARSSSPEAPSARDPRAGVQSLW